MSRRRIVIRCLIIGHVAGLLASLVWMDAAAAVDRWLLPENSVGSRHVQPESIRAGDIADEGVSWRTLGWRVQSHLDPQVMVFRVDGRELRCVADREAPRDFVFDCERAS